MKKFTVVLPLLGLMILIPAVALGTLRFENRNNDGPSIRFPGGELISGKLHQGPDPGWSFTQDISTVELQLEDMSSFLGRLWKHWAVFADEGSGLAVVRINGVRYERHSVPLNEAAVLEGYALASKSKYNSPTTRASIEAGNTWVFELAPKGS